VLRLGERLGRQQVDGGGVAVDGGEVGGGVLARPGCRRRPDATGGGGGVTGRVVVDERRTVLVEEERLSDHRTHERAEPVAEV